MSFIQNYIEQLKKDFPGAERLQSLAPLLNPNLVSSQCLALPRAAIEQIQNFVSTVYKLRGYPEYQKYILASHSLFREPDFISPQNFSALMSFDFHLVNDHHPKLIEINTNASSSLIIHESYQTQNISNFFARNTKAFDKDIVSCFEDEFSRWVGASTSPKKKLKTIAIVDEHPSQQKLYLEFLLYQDLFIQNGYSCVISDPSELTLKRGRLFFQDSLEIDMVYNRHTDFYFSTPACLHLREAYVKAYACFTPHPFEYALLADKSRLFDFSNSPQVLKLLSKDDCNLIQSLLLKSYDVQKVEDKAWLWANKKILFFKPKRSFGGKASYRGQGITRGVFANIIAGDYLAQEFAPPSEIEVTLEDHSRASFKYDLRFYVYHGRIQLALARLWRGQMTNINSLGGGLAPIFVIS